MAEGSFHDLKAVIFDMDGVLIDARDWHYRALNEALELFGTTITYEEHLNRFNGLPTREKLTALTSDGRLPKHLHPVVSAVKQERTLREAARLCFPMVDHLLLVSWLRARRLKVGVATNSIRATSTTMLQFAGILDQLDCLVTNEDVDRAKPHPDVYLKACSSLGVDPSSTLVVEDHPIGVQAAMSAGCQVIRVAGPEDVNIALLEGRLQVFHAHSEHADA